MKRPSVNERYPLHVTWRLRKGLPDLRLLYNLGHFRHAAAESKAYGFRVLHFSLESNHIHMIVEADSNKELANGMRSLGCRFAKLVLKTRRERARSGSHSKNSDVNAGSGIFAGRYHTRILKTPTEAKNAIAYVLLNHSKHTNFVEHIDDFSSGYHFQNWKALLGRNFKHLIQDQIEFRDENGGYAGLEQALSQPRSWLAKVGWMKSSSA